MSVQALCTIDENEEHHRKHTPIVCFCPPHLLEFYAHGCLGSQRKRGGPPADKRSDPAAERILLVDGGWGHLSCAGRDALAGGTCHCACGASSHSPPASTPDHRSTPAHIHSRASTRALIWCCRPTGDPPASPEAFSIFRQTHAQMSSLLDGLRPDRPLCRTPPPRLPLAFHS